MSTRVIIYAKPEEMILAARMAATVMSNSYRWPEDGIALFEYGEGNLFSARKNKSSITIYSQQMERR